MVIRISDKTQNYSKVTKLLVKPFVFTLLDWDRTTDFIIKKETIDKENHYLIDLNKNLLMIF